MSKNTLTGAQILWDCLVREGVDVVFGYPGGAILPAYDAMLDFRSVTFSSATSKAPRIWPTAMRERRGKVGVAVATSGPGRHQHGHGHRHGDDGLVSDRLHHRPGGKSRSSAPMHSRKRTSPASRSPSPSTIILVTRASRYRARHPRGVRHCGERPARPVLVDITKDAQLGSCEFDWDAAAPDLASLARPGHSSGDDPLTLINAAQRPLILAGHGIILGGAEAALQAFAEKAHIPVAMTLLGIGGFPASHPLNLGMMGMHGEAWVNTAIQEADLLIALGMRFDDRVTGNLKTYAQTARKIHVDIDPASSTRTSASTPPYQAMSAPWFAPGCREWPTTTDRPGSITSPSSKAIRRFATSRTCPTTGTCTRRT